MNSARKPESSSRNQAAGTNNQPLFTVGTANQVGYCTTDLKEIAEFAILLANGMKPIRFDRRIKLKVYELGKPTVTFDYHR